MLEQDSRYQFLRDSLLGWYELHKRDLPFRTHPTPYKIWVSEVMLQQTRVKSMLSLYNQFLLRFPDMESLAEASEEEVLKYWRGLGYYSRARNLRKACQYILSKFEGKFPQNLEDALSVPGVGPYTARAVLSIGYNKAYAVLDGNVKRVISRVFAERDEKKWQILADRFLNLENPSEHNQAMMELGALVCLPIPRCTKCPLNEGCKAYEKNLMRTLPPPRKEPKKLSIELHFYIIMRTGRVLLIKDKNRRFFKNLFCLPYSIRTTNPTIRLPNSYHTPEYLITILKHLRTTLIPGKIKHSITHHNIEIFLHKTDPDFTDFCPSKEVQELWIKWENLEEYFPSSLARKLLQFPVAEDLFCV